METIVIRPGRPEDAADFSRLLLISVPRFLPAVYGTEVGRLMERLFPHRQHFFSYEHTQFIELDGRLAGMTLTYNHAAKTAGRTVFGLLLARYMGLGLLRHYRQLTKIEPLLGAIESGEYYASNSALYPEFRGRGLGRRLFAVAEQNARREGCRRLVCEAESDNATAIGLRRKLGFRIERSLQITDLAGENFEFARLVKDLDK
ncbi:MAG: RimI4 [Proteobacteria bacterium]|nr:RimI4 [Pseudomonadota bacterium]